MMVRLAVGIAALAMLSAGVQARTTDEPGAAAAMLSRCLASPDQPFPPEARAVAAPPGLAHAQGVAVAVTPAGRRRLFAFHGTGNDLVCGMAIYGRVHARTREALEAMLDRQPHWQRSASTPNAAVDALPVRSLYWEDALAPGLAGATMTMRAASRRRPALEIAVRHTLVR